MSNRSREGPGDPGGEAVACYQTFMRGLLESPITSRGYRDPPPVSSGTMVMTLILLWRRQRHARSRTCKGIAAEYGFLAR
ncbi:MAG: hypothetical protein Ct9H300mP16_08690 [Pseudomonadota bacterium]|nr:MAG: hypothetical protein Ct9H300mP16_08690 [Pseudomonadota bacterium]